MAKSRRLRRLWDTYRFPGFRPSHTVSGRFGDPKVRIIRLHRRAKKRAAASAAGGIPARMITPSIWSAISPAVIREFTLPLRCVGSTAGVAAR